MDVLDQICSLIQPDVQQCLIGIEQGDFHLLEINKPRIDHYISLLYSLISEIEDVESVLQYIEYLEVVRSAVESVLEREEDLEASANLRIPKNVEFVIYLRQLGMPWSKIGAAHGVSRQAMYNFRKKHKIQEPNTEVDNEELQQLISHLTFEKPRAGAVYTKGRLTSMRIKVSLKRVKETLRQANPYGTLLRWREKIPRRQYKVKAANTLWCNDSNHKLIALRLVLHGCIDAFSRKIIYLKIATNNLAETVLGMFLEGVERNGLPKRVRGDRGVENVRVKEFMEEARSEATNPYILGRSVHNTRIERLWRETNHHISYKYKVIFQHLEDIGLLDQHSELDLFCVAAVFLPRIQRELDQFVATWNNHAMSTMGGRTPEQMWTISMVMQQQLSCSNVNSPLAGVYDGDSSAFNYYNDTVNNNCPFGCPETLHDLTQMESENSHNFDDSPIEVPECSLSNSEFLKSLISAILPNPLAEDGNFGISLYEFVRSCITNVINQRS